MVQTNLDGTFEIPSNLIEEEQTIYVQIKDNFDRVHTLKEHKVQVEADMEAPDVPIVNEVTNKDSAITGTSEPGATIHVTIEGQEIGIAVTDENGHFSVAIQPQSTGTVLEVTATDPAGNRSNETKVTVKDDTIPEPPIITETTESTAVTGVAEPKSKITVRVHSEIIAVGYADDEGNFHITFPYQPPATVLKLTVTNAAGNTSPELEVIVVDITPPKPPLVNEVTDQSNTVTGEAEPGSKVTVKHEELYSNYAIADKDGRFSVPIPLIQAGKILDVSASDSTGNKSEIVKVTVVDKVAPQKPEIYEEISDQSTKVNGSAEQGSEIIVKVGTTKIGTGITDVNGNFSVEIPKQKVGDILVVTATDKAGNKSKETYVVVVDRTGPQVSSTNPTNNQNAVPNDMEITITFDENISENMPLDQIVLKNSREENIEVSKTITDNVLSLTPTYELEGQSTYTVTIPSGILQDAFGNTNSNEFIFSFKTVEYSNPISGGIYENTILTKAKSPYVVTGDIVVFPDATLTIEPGVEVQFLTGTSLKVRGELVSKGTEQAPITYTNVTKRKWNGISIETQFGGKATIDYSTISNAEVGLKSNCCGSDNGNDSFISITNSTFSQNEIGLSGGLAYGEFTVKNTFFSNNNYGIKDVSNLLLFNSVFKNNEVAGSGINNFSLVYENSFSENKVAIENMHYATIAYNLFTNNELAIAINGYSTIAYNVIKDNQKGLTYSSYAEVMHNQINSNDIGLIIDYHNVEEIAFNSLDNNHQYNVKYLLEANIDLQENWWGTTNVSSLQSLIYDGYDDSALGLVKLPNVANGDYEYIDREGPYWVNNPLSYDNITDKSIDLSIYNYNIFDHSGLKAFDIFLDGKKLTRIEAEGAWSKHTINNLKSGVEYRITVKAIDYKDNSSKQDMVVTFQTKDIIPPLPPKVNLITENNDVITGTAEVNSWITVKRNGTTIGESYADSDGSFSVWVDDNVLKVDDVIEVTASDNHGNASEPTTVTVKDITSPGPPEINHNTIDEFTKNITGKTEPYAQVHVYLNDKEIGSSQAMENGVFSVSIPQQKAGATLKVTATDKYGNVSPSSSVYVYDMTPPITPVVNKVTDQSTSITGTSEAGSYVVAQMPDGSDKQVVAKADGSFAITITKQKARSKISVYSYDIAGNFSSTVDVTVEDVTSPNLTVDQVTDKSTKVTGKTEEGATVEVLNNDTVIGSSIATDEGAFSVTIPVQKAGSELQLQAKDKAEYKSPVTTVTVKDTTAPAAPTVHEVTDQSTTVRGKAEAGSTINIKVGPIQIGTATTAVDGNFTVNIAKQKAGSVLFINATDRADNASTVKEITVKDATAPYWEVGSSITHYVSGTGVDLVWPEASDNVFASKYRIKQNGVVIQEQVAPITNYSVNGLKSDTEYEFSIEAGDQAGNWSVGLKKKVRTEDVEAPQAPTVNEVTDQSTEVTGKAEAGSKVEVKLDGNVIGSITTKPDGTFFIKIPVLKAGTTLTVTATDEAKNVSKKTAVVVKDVTAPEKPTVNEITDQSTEVTGKAEAGSTISVTANNIEIGNSTVKSDGTFTIEIPLQPAGTSLTIISIDNAGNQSEDTNVHV